MWNGVKSEEPLTTWGPVDLVEVGRIAGWGEEEKRVTVEALIKESPSRYRVEGG